MNFSVDDNSFLFSFGYRHRQDHKIFVEIAKCAEKCLREASKYGEVR